MKIMSESATLVILCLLASSNEAFCQDSSCNTPIECYRKSLDEFNKLKIEFNKLKKEINIPKNTVAAFNLPSCPPGWATFNDAAGRVIVGSGNGSGLSSRTFGEKGGEETHLLAINEMPKHRHQLPTYNGQSGGEEVGTGHYGSDFFPPEYSAYEGDDKPHNNMQPYLVLTVCIKQKE